MTNEELNRADNLMRSRTKRRSPDMRTTEEIEDAADRGEEKEETDAPMGPAINSYAQQMIDNHRKG